MKLSDRWFMGISEAENDGLIVVNGRDDLKEWMTSQKLNERVEISWKYEEGVKGMPSEEEACRMDEMQEALRKAMERNKLAILTGIYTGDGERTWVFYTRNIKAFGDMLNQTLAPFDLFPITLYTEKDPEWNEYREMYELKGQSVGENENE